MNDKPELIIIGDGVVPDIKMEILSFTAPELTASEVDKLIEALNSLANAGIRAEDALRNLRQAFGTMEIELKESDFTSVLQNIERPQLDKLVKEDKRPYYRRFSKRKW